MPTRVTLGGRLCTTRETQANDQATISELKNGVETQLSATVKGAGTEIGGGFRKHKGSETNQNSSQTSDSSREALETQGGNGLLASRYGSNRPIFHFFRLTSQCLRLDGFDSFLQILEAK